MTLYLPLHAVHAELGAVFKSLCDWELPFSYGDPESEYRAVRRAAGLVDRSHTDVLEATGRDRVAFLQGMLTNDLKVLAPGRGCRAAFLDARGRVQALLTVLVLEERLLLLLAAGFGQRTLQGLDRFLISEKVSLRDAGAETARFMVAGPRAAALIERLTGTPPLAAPWAHEERQVEEIPVRVVTGGGETGEAEAWLIPARREAERVWRSALRAGAPDGLRPVGAEALDVLRVEAGVPWDGHDVDEGVLLPEIPSEPYVSYTKGCYVGQEVVARIKYRGHVNRSLTGLAFEGDRVPAPGAPVHVGDRDVGRVTSAVFSFGLRRPIALAYVRREHLAPGTAVVVHDNGRTLPACVTSLPFVAAGAA